MRACCRRKDLRQSKKCGRRQPSSNRFKSHPRASFELLLLWTGSLPFRGLTEPSLSTAAVGASNKIQSIIEKSFEIEPSPSGVTRIHINNYDSSNNNNPVSLNDNKMTFYSNYKPVTVEFTSNPSSFYPARLNLNSANDFFQKPNKTDNCTSPIRILNAKSDETSFNLLKGYFLFLIIA